MLAKIAEDTRILSLPRIEDPRGSLTVIEQMNHVPFEIKRVYMVCGIGSNADMNTAGVGGCSSGNLFIVTLCESTDIIVGEGDCQQVYRLDQLDRGLYIKKGTKWMLANMHNDARVLILTDVIHEDSCLDKCIDMSSRVDYPIKRVFYTYNVPDGEDRGAHAHKACVQYFIAAFGCFEATLDDGINKQTVVLDSPLKGVKIPAGIWASEQNFTPGGICLVLTSQEYDEHDYIRNYDEFIHYINNKQS